MLKFLTIKALKAICNTGGLSDVEIAQRLRILVVSEFTLADILPVCERDEQIRTRIRASIEQHPEAWDDNPDGLQEAAGEGDAALRDYIMNGTAEDEDEDETIGRVSNGAEKPVEQVPGRPILEWPIATISVNVKSYADLAKMFAALS
jgi:hypothetical protein